MNIDTVSNILCFVIACGPNTHGRTMQHKCSHRLQHINTNSSLASRVPANLYPFFPGSRKRGLSSHHSAVWMVRHLEFSVSPFPTSICMYSCEIYSVLWYLLYSNVSCSDVSYNIVRSMFYNSLNSNGFSTFISPNDIECTESILVHAPGARWRCF